MSGQTATKTPTIVKRQVTGPNGTPIGLDDLPPPETTRWVMRRKAEVVSAVRGGLLTVEEACARWNLSLEEYESWQRLIDRYGVRGLRATRLQQYRGADRRSVSNDRR
ncbi:MAG: DUF1153 domain-containing protein [Thalassobaculum sp.]|uniref:CtrA inhibitor SciP n=1 Tax=Thalassobaculum sp. TaxID=2022740 RepID=UPI0032EBA4AB